jgi:uncharacterized protein (DUF849 family)
LSRCIALLSRFAEPFDFAISGVASVAAAVGSDRAESNGRNDHTCAVTGNMTSREQHPRLPVTPEEIADASIGAAHAGASIVHIHVRDPVSGAPSMSLELYREVVQRLRPSGVDVLINLTTGPGGRFIPSDNDPQRAAPGSSLTVPGRRVEHVIDLRPDICSLDLNTMISGPSVVINTPKNITLMAQSIVALTVDRRQW